MNTLTGTGIVIIILLLALFLTSLVLIFQHRKTREYRDYIRNIHASLGISEETKPELGDFLEKINSYRLKSDFQVTIPDTGEILNFISETSETFYTSLHATYREEDIFNIMREGLKFEDDLYKTSLSVSSNPVDIKYKLHLCKAHGCYVAVICIPRNLHNLVKNEIVGNKRHELVETYLCETISEGELKFCLPGIFIKGYVNLLTQTIVNNPKFLSSYSEVYYIEEVRKKLKE